MIDKISRQSEWIRSDWVKRNHNAALAFKRAVCKSIVCDSYSSITIRYKIFSAAAVKLIHYSVTEQRNKCRVSGRSYFVLTRAGLARMQFKFAAGCGLLSGVARHGK